MNDNFPTGNFQEQIRWLRSQIFCLKEESAANQNIYNTSSSLTEPREVTMGANNLSFLGSTAEFVVDVNNSSFKVSPGSTEIVFNNGASLSNLIADASGLVLSKIDGAGTSQFQMVSTGMNFVNTPGKDIRFNADPGTSGFVLTSQGAGFSPVWAAIPSAIDTYLGNTDQLITDPVRLVDVGSNELQINGLDGAISSTSIFAPDRIRFRTVETGQGIAEIALAPDDFSIFYSDLGGTSSSIDFGSGTFNFSMNNLGLGINSDEGTAGQYLGSNGPGTPPTWQSLPAATVDTNIFTNDLTLTDSLRTHTIGANILRFEGTTGNTIYVFDDGATASHTFSWNIGGLSSIANAGALGIGTLTSNFTNFLAQQSDTSNTSGIRIIPTNINLQFAGTSDIRINNDPGLAGQVLVSGGPGAAPTWGIIAGSNNLIFTSVADQYVITDGAGSLQTDIINWAYTDLDINLPRTHTINADLIYNLTTDMFQVSTVNGSDAIITSFATTGHITSGTDGVNVVNAVTNVDNFQVTNTAGSNSTTYLINDDVLISNATDGANSTGFAVRTSGVEMLFAGVSDLKINLNPGTLGQALLSQGPGAAPIWATLPSGVTTFVGLSDTPGAMGTAGQQLQVNAGGTALEFFTPTPVDTLYTADGTLAGTRLVTMGANDLAFISGGGSLAYAFVSGLDQSTAQFETTSQSQQVTNGTALSNHIMDLTRNVLNFANGGNNINVNMTGQGIDFSFGGIADFRLDGNAGLAGQILTSNGPNTAPTWVTPSAGFGGFNIDGDTGGPTGITSGSTITFTGGTNIATVVAGNVVTFNWSANASDLGDVNTAGATSGQVLQFNGSTWIPFTLPTGFTSFDITGDSGAVNTVTDGSSYAIAGGTNIGTVNSAGTTTINWAAVLADIADVSITSPAVGQALIFTGAGWQNQTLPTGFTSFDVAADSGGAITVTDGVTQTFAGGTNISTVNSGTTTTFNWAAAIGDLSNVNVGGATSGQRLEFDGANWIPVTPVTGITTFNVAGDAGVDLTLSTSGSTINLLGGAGIATFGLGGLGIRIDFDGGLTNMSDVDLTGLTTGQVLQYNGTNFVPVTLPGASSTLYTGDGALAGPRSVTMAGNGLTLNSTSGNFTYNSTAAGVANMTTTNGTESSQFNMQAVQTSLSSSDATQDSDLILTGFGVTLQRTDSTTGRGMALEMLANETRLRNSLGTSFAWHRVPLESVTQSQVQTATSNGLIEIDHSGIFGNPTISIENQSIAGTSSVELADGAVKSTGRREIISFETVASTTGAINDYPVQTDVAILKIPLTATRTLSGIVPPADNTVLIVMNISTTSNLNIRHQNVASAAANRIICENTSSLVIREGGVATLWYDGDVSRWRVIGTSRQ